MKTFSELRALVAAECITEKVRYIYVYMETKVRGWRLFRGNVDRKVR